MRLRPEDRCTQSLGLSSGKGPFARSRVRRDEGTGSVLFGWMESGNPEQVGRGTYSINEAGGVEFEPVPADVSTY